MLMKYWLFFFGEAIKKPLSLWLLQAVCKSFAQMMTTNFTIFVIEMQHIEPKSKSARHCWIAKVSAQGSINMFTTVLSVIVWPESIIHFHQNIFWMLMWEYIVSLTIVRKRLYLEDGTTLMLEKLSLRFLGATVEKMWLMDLGRLVFGIGGESLNVVQSTYTVLWFKDRELNLVFGLQLSMSTIVSLLAFLCVIWCTWCCALGKQYKTKKKIFFHCLYPVCYLLRDRFYDYIKSSGYLKHLGYGYIPHEPLVHVPRCCIHEWPRTEKGAGCTQKRRQKIFRSDLYICAMGLTFWKFTSTSAVV